MLCASGCDAVFKVQSAQHYDAMVPMHPVTKCYQQPCILKYILLRLTTDFESLLACAPQASMQPFERLQPAAWPAKQAALLLP